MQMNATNIENLGKIRREYKEEEIKTQNDVRNVIGVKNRGKASRPGDFPRNPATWNGTKTKEVGVIDLNSIIDTFQSSQGRVRI